MKNKRILILAIIFLIALSTLVYASIQAQKSTGGIAVHPSNFDITAVPNQNSTGVITVDNLTSQPMQILVNLRNFTAQGEEGSVNLTAEDTTYSLAKWIKVEPATVEIKAHSSQDFTFTIEVPKNAEPGGHFGSVVFTTAPSKDLKGSGAALSQEVASLILFKIPGSTKEQAMLESFTTDKSFYEFGPVTFNARVKNEGGVHIAPAGSIVVKGWFGQKFIVPLEMRNVLPDATRKIPATLKNKLLFGKFTATLIATYGTQGQQLYQSTGFSAFPVRYGVIALIILIVLYLGRKRIARSIKVLLTGT
jgi:hypothetical protein